MCINDGALDVHTNFPLSTKLPVPHIVPEIQNAVPNKTINDFLYSLYRFYT